MTPAQTDVERVARDLEHTGELSMPYRCEIADILRTLAGLTQHKTGLAEDARIMQKRIGSTPFPEGFQQIADDAHVMIARQAFRVADLEKRIAAMQPSVAEAAKVLLDLLETPSEIAPISGDKIEHVWHETFRQSGFCAVSGFLRALSKETPDAK